MQPLRRQLLGLFGGLVLLAGCQSSEPEPVRESKAALTDADFITYAVKPSLTDGWKSCYPVPEPGAIGCPQHTDAPDAEHVLYVNEDHVDDDGRLLVYLPGTNVDPGWTATDPDGGIVNECQGGRCNFYRVAADQGYHVIALSYFTASTPSFGNVDGYCKTHLWTTQQMACIPQYMNEVLNGSPNCPAEVCPSELTTSQHPQDSIVARLKSLLTWAVANHPWDGWDQYLNTNGNVKWGQVVITGSSLGSSYATMIAQQHPSIPRVALLAGPNDGHGSAPESWTVAPWLEDYCPAAQCSPLAYCPDLCPDGGPNFFGLVHEKNKMESESGPSRLHETTAAYRALGMGPVTYFDPEPNESPNFQGAHVLISTDPETTAVEAHESVTQDRYDECPGSGTCKIGYEAAWRRLVGSGI